MQASADEVRRLEAMAVTRYIIQLFGYTLTMAVLTPVWPELVNYFTQDVSGELFWDNCCSLIVFFSCVLILGCLHCGEWVCIICVHSDSWIHV